MSKRLKAADFITSTSRYPVKSGTWNFLQDSYNEQIKDMMIAAIGPSYSNTSVYVIWGCEVTIVSSTATISEGSIFYNGEVYHVVGNSTTAPASGLVNVIDLEEVSTVASNYDPVQYTDGVNHDVFISRNAKLASRGSGLGSLSNTAASDYTALLNIGSWIPITTPVTITGAPGGATFTITTVGYNRFKIIGRTLFWQLCIQSMGIGGSATANVAYISFPTAITNLIKGLPKNLNSWHVGFVYKGLPSCYYLENSGGTPRLVLVTPPNQTYWTLGTNQAFDTNVCIEF